MPNRILREGILTSQRVNLLKEKAELFYRRLMSVVDDFGRYDARPNLLRVVVYPLKVDSIREADITRLLAEVQQAGLVALYEVDGKAYLQMLDFRQQVRATASKYPAPDDQVIRTCYANGMQMHTQSYSESETYAKTETGDKSPPGKRFAPPEESDALFHGVKIGLPQREVEKFMAYYGSKGWKVGRSPMQDWRKAMVGWRSRWEESGRPGAGEATGSGI